MMMNKKNLFRGFTLIELLVVMAILGVLFTTLIVAVNPARQLARARDTSRETDIYAILGAIFEYQSEHGGDLPETDTQEFPTSATCIGSAVGCFDLAGAGGTGTTIIPIYLAQMPTDPRPVDPNCPGDQTNTCYEIWVDVNNRLHASASGELRTIGVVK